MTTEYFSYEYYEDLYYNEPERLYKLFSASERYTILLIAEYLEARNYTWFCYHGLYYYYIKLRNKKFHWHTIERNIRRLTYTYNLFTPRHSKYSNHARKGCFTPTRSCYLILDVLKPRLAEAGMPGSNLAAPSGSRPASAGGRW